MTTLLIGYGNTLRSDDGIGPIVAEHFAGRAGLDALSTRQLTPDLAEIVARAERLILVDAQTGQPPGEVATCAVTPTDALPSTMVHHITPEVLLTTALALYGHCPPTTLITVNAADFAHGEGLSPAVEAALPQVIALIETLLA